MAKIDMTTIYLIRHGQSMGNLERRLLGHTDLPLTELGRKQAERAASYLATLGITRVYSSDLLRALETVTPLARRLSLPLIPEPGLREVYAGEWEGLPFSEIKERWAEEYRIFRTDLGRSTPPGGESSQHAADRLFETMSHIVRENEGERILVASHAAVICMFTARVLGLAPSEVQRLRLASNASVSVYEHDGERFHLAAYGNDGYLGELRIVPPPRA